MDSFEWNKIFGAVLGTVLFILAVRVAAETVFHEEPLQRQAYIVEGVEESAEHAAPAAPTEEPMPDFGTVIPAANVAAGEQAAAVCGACHTFTKGGANGVGPNLYGVVARAKAGHAGYAYSPALQGKGGDWSYEDLFRFLKSPALFAPGTKMAFAGLPRTQDRINVIAYMRAQADAPAPLPPPQPAAPAAEAAPADGTAAPANAEAPAAPAADPLAAH
jgi:cytochrome c